MDFKRSSPRLLLFPFLFIFILLLLFQRSARNGWLRAGATDPRSPLHAGFFAPTPVDPAYQAPAMCARTHTQSAAAAIAAVYPGVRFNVLREEERVSRVCSRACTCVRVGRVPGLARLGLGWVGCVETMDDFG